MKKQPARKKRQRKQRGQGGGKAAKTARPSGAGPAESVPAEAATVAWSLTVLMTLLCDLVAGVGGLVLWQWPSGPGVALFIALAGYSAILIGTLSLVLLPVMLKLRTTPPPRSITGFALLVCGAPWTVMAVLWLAVR